MTAPAQPWRVLIFDASDDDPLWAVATIIDAGDVRPAVSALGGRYADWEQVREWVRERVGPRAQLTPASISVWRITGETANGGQS